jgi:multisubunit Na+/H+ antiporter MnhF subunit
MVRLEDFGLLLNFAPNISSLAGLGILALGCGYQFQVASPVSLALFVAFASICIEKLHPFITGSDRFIASDILTSILVSSLGSLFIYFAAALVIIAVMRILVGRRRKKRVFSRAK